MPIAQDTAYLTVAQVMLLARALDNDMLFSQAGEVLTDTQPALFPLMNESLAEFEEEINNHGVTTFVKETILPSVLPIAVNDPGKQVYLSDTGYFDGVNNYQNPFVPSDLLVPLFLWERQSGSTETWVEMVEKADGLPSVVQSSRLRIWEWRNELLVFPGATQSNDVRMRYTGSHALLVTVNDTIFFRGPYAVGAVAWLFLANWYASKNPEQSAVCRANAMRRIAQGVSRTSRQKQRETITRRSYGNPRGGATFIPPRNP